MEKKKVELWDGYDVEINGQLLDDFDYIQDLAAAQRKQDLPEVISLYFAAVGGEDVYLEVRKHVEDECGYFSQTELFKIIDKINAAFPKVGNRAERRSWKTSK